MVELGANGRRGGAAGGDICSTHMYLFSHVKQTNRGDTGAGSTTSAVDGKLKRVYVLHYRSGAAAHVFVSRRSRIFGDRSRLCNGELLYAALGRRHSGKRAW